MNIRKAHFIGIGGVGMSATAKLLKDSGVKVTGSDEEVYPPISNFLKQEGLLYQTPYKAENIPPDADVIVIGKNAKLVLQTNPEVAAAFASGKKILSFPQVLAELSKDKETIVVAGSYGKSTSTALLAHCLESAGLDPSFFIGAVPLTPHTSAHMGRGSLFVLEGDEYPSSNTDPRAKFLLMHPSHALITPLAHDHLNVFPTPEAYLQPFFELIKILPAEATAVVCAEGPLSKEFIANAPRLTTTYGLDAGEFHATNIVYGEKTSFDIAKNNSLLARVDTTQLGKHNIQNIVGVAAFLFTRNLISPEKFASAVASFKGVTRRLDRKSSKTSIPIFEGFGSSYEKLKSAVAAMKLHFPHRRLWVVFEPHTFSWRNEAALPWYDDIFAGASKVLIYEPASQGANTHRQLTQAQIVERVQKSDIHAVAITSPEQALALLQQELQPNDCILLSTSGNLGGLIESVPKLAEQKFPT